MNVARSEGQLLTLARALVDGTHPAVIAPLLGDAQPLAPAIGPTAMGVLQDTLAKGTVLTLVRNSGWRVQRRPRGGELVEGRLWERHPAPALRFSKWSYQVLRMLVTNALVTECKAPRAPSAPGDGDRILALLVARTLVTLGYENALAAVEHEPLVQLAFPWWVQPVEVDWVGFLRERTWMIEGLHDLIAQAWIDAEREKLGTRSPGRLLAGSTRQAAVLHGYLDAITALGRPDLADVLMTVGEVLVPDPFAPVLSIVHRDLDPTASLRERTEATRASGPLLDALLRVQQLVAHDRTVRFFDDDYEATQERLKRWEQFNRVRSGTDDGSDARIAAIRRAREQLHA
ncbi:MAG: hypothetical protein R3F61_13280 [Myxococcota bacterium]